MSLSSARHLLVLGLLGAVSGLAPAAEPTTVLCYRLCASTAFADREQDALGMSLAVPREVLLLSLLEQGDCTVEKLGEATIREGAFSSDATTPVHFMVRRDDGSYALETAAKRAGFVLTGTVGRAGGDYVLRVDCMHTTFRRSLPANDPATAAADLAIGRPLMDVRHMATTVHATPGVAACIGSGGEGDGHGAPQRFISFYVMLK